MKKTEGDELKMQIRQLELQNVQLRTRVRVLQEDVNELRPAMLKAMALLGKWMSQRYDRERYPVGSTRDFLKAWWR